MRNYLLLFIAFSLLIQPLQAQTPPTKKDDLLKWLQAGAYLNSFSSEPTVHESFTAHGSYVRTWYNRKRSNYDVREIFFAAAHSFGVSSWTRAAG